METLKNFVKDITNEARFCRLLNLLQANGKCCVDKTKYVDIKALRNLLYWDLYEYLTDREWGTTVEGRVKEMKTKTTKMICSDCETLFKEKKKIREMNVGSTKFQALALECPGCGQNFISEEDVESAMSAYEKASKQPPKDE